MVPVFRAEPLAAILAHVEAALAAGADAVTLRVLDPDRGRGRYAGELVDVDGVPHVHRPLRAWVDLADRLGLRLCTPRAAEAPLVELRLERLDAAARWQADAPDDVRERYGPASAYGRIRKLEEPGLAIDLAAAFRRVGLAAGARVLALGVNTGDELALLAGVVPGLAEQGTLAGVDHSEGALAVARARFPGERHRFVAADLARLGELGLGRFDLVLALGVLQSPGVDDRALLRAAVQDHLAAAGAVVLGIPNCRYLDGELVHGARMKNFREPELGLVVKDVAFYRKYLQQHGRQVFVTGQHYLLVTAVARA
ncbi:MAG TPA: methyltransferase domain-containing protein [Kofleriaceae bacterium]|nr:methyltransferase domain-containing protein [Kofleriaceae bacterium]